MKPAHQRSTLLTGLCALTIGAALAACGSDPPSGSAGGECERPGRTADSRPAPTRIVSLSPTATEMLFAIGACSQVVAVDSLSTYPAGTPVTDLSAYEPNAEAVAGYDPDLVVVVDDSSGITSALTALDIPTLVLPAATTIGDTYAQISQLGGITGHIDRASDTVAGMKTRLAEVVASLPEEAEGLTYYHELDDTYYSVTSRTFIGEMYAELGLRNIADAADPDGSGYPQLSAEHILDSDPDVILLADTKCCAQTAATVAARPGWGDLTAVRTGRVIALDDDIASRWGPRIIDLLETVGAELSRPADG